MSTSFLLRLSVFTFASSMVIAACGTDRYVVAVVGSSGGDGSGTASSGASSSTNAGNTNRGSGGIDAGIGGTSVVGGSVGGGGDSGSRNPSGGSGGASRESGGASAASGGAGATDGASGGSGGVIMVTGGGSSTSENAAGGGAGGVRSVDTQRTSLGGSESTTTTGFTSESCLCQMVTTPQCIFDGVTGEQTCALDCVMWPGECDQGCPCMESMPLSYSPNDAEAKIDCTNPNGCEPTNGCAVEFSKFPPYRVKRSSCVVLISLP